MLATVTTILAAFAILLGLGVGAMATVLGAMVAMLAHDGDLPFPFPPVWAGIVAVVLGLAIFLAAATFLPGLLA